MAAGDEPGIERVVPDSLLLVRRGLRFADPSTEAAYRSWRTRLHRGTNHVAFLFAVLGVIVFVGLGTLAPAELRPWLLGFLFLSTLLLAGEVLARPTRFGPAMSALATGSIGSMMVGLCFLLLRKPEWGVLVTVSVEYYAFTAARRELRLALFSVAPMVGLHEIATMRGLVGGDLDALTAAICLVMPLSVLLRGTAINIANERSSRVAFQSERLIDLQRHEIGRERERADGLLASILPSAIALRLKHDRQMIADHFDAVTVLFADIVGFTPLSARLSPRALVELLNQIFTEFDELARRHGLEKIKTIGDAYMVVSGLPEPRLDHAAAAASMALDMRRAVERLGGGLEIRIGLHTGPVVAGVIGTSKFSYDLWGDTVNTASRMESHGAAGSIHVTDTVRSMLSDSFLFEERGVVEIKGKGPMRTWWLKGSPASGRPAPLGERS